jgi:hypothetical protein
VITDDLAIKIEERIAAIPNPIKGTVGQILSYATLRRVAQAAAEVARQYFAKSDVEQPDSAPIRDALRHSRSCPSSTPGDGPCTCALVERTALETERTMYAAWRKRAEEAEAEIERLRALDHLTNQGAN